MVRLLDGRELTQNTARLPLPLHLALVEDQTSLPARQPRLGVPEVRKVEAVREEPERGKMLRYHELELCGGKYTDK